MLAATAFSLLVPALDDAAVGPVLVGFAVGAAVIVALDRWLPPLHARWREGPREPMVESTQVNRVLLLLATSDRRSPSPSACRTRPRALRSPRFGVPSGRVATCRVGVLRAP